jgi:predicted HTH domain antitoxin
LELDRALQWTAGDVHRFVAHYLAIRFPVCLALNKIDAFEEEIQGLDLDKKDEVEEKITRKVLLLADLNSDKATLATTLPCDSEDKIKTIKKNGKEIVQFCQKQAIQRGETAVAVSAFVEGWEILKRSARVLENERRNFDSLYSERRTKLLDLDQIKVEKDNKEDHAFLPSVGSLLWLINESAAKRVNDIWKSTGTLYFDIVNLEERMITN